MATFSHTIKLSFFSKKKILLFAILSIIMLLLGTIITAKIKFYNNKIYPNVKINNIDVGGITMEEAQQKIMPYDNSHLPHILKIEVDDIFIASESSDLNIENDFETATKMAFLYGREGNIRSRLEKIVNLAFEPYYITTNYVYDKDAIWSMINTLKINVNLEEATPSAELLQSNIKESIEIYPGKNGRHINEEATIEKIIDSLKNSNSKIGFNLEKNKELKNEGGIALFKVGAVVSSSSAQLSDEEVIVAKLRAEKFVGKTIKFKTQDKNNQDIVLTLNDREIISLLKLPHGYSDQKLMNLLEMWSKAISRPAQNAEFEFDPQTLKVTRFYPHKDGISLNIKNTEQQILEILEKIESDLPTEPTSTNQDEEITLPLYISLEPPQKTLSSTNNLGINELIAFGDSYYDHSIPSRVHNVALTSEKINFTIVPPGEEFSFNKTVGEVSAKTGYQPAYIIKNGATELGDGGGVCQVSTTLFRALINGGFLITKRRPHSYRVSYYEQNSIIGIDATVYSGDVDLRFVNDTQSHILILSQAETEKRYMKVEIYGTSDGRSTEISNYKTWDAQPPLPTQYIPDSTLPTGKLKQIDWSAPGLKTSFVNIIKNADGEIIREDTYFSYYKPWAAKFLQGI